MAFRLSVISLLSTMELKIIVLLFVVSSDLKRRVSLDFLRFSEIRFSDCWILDNVCAMENGFPRLYI